MTDTLQKIFLDRRAEFFGRESDVHRLMDLARKPGVTSVIAPPLMGKTWTMNEVARRLTEEGRYLVGYHESRGTEASHLLNAVSDLYTRWLNDSTMRDQAISLWERHKENLVPRIGTMVGKLFANLGGLSAGVAAIVSASFNGLVEAQKDLLSGGMQLPQLSYDEALSLTNLVAKLSDRRIVLILDAWEKAPSIHSDSANLELYLSHQDDWPATHIFLGIRNPDKNAFKANDEAFMRASDLQALSPAARVYDLQPIALENPKECASMVRYLLSNFPATRGMNEQELLQMIGGFPGVLYFWGIASDRNELSTKADLVRNANDAHFLRYSEFDHLLKGLPENQLTLAVRVAFFPRLNAEAWNEYKRFLLMDLTDAAFDALVDSKILNDERFPTYGHDTRHAAALQWFIRNNLALIRRKSESLIESLASHVAAVNRADRLIVGALSACFESARQVKANQTVCCLINAARSAFGDTNGIFHHSFDETYPEALGKNATFVTLITLAISCRGYYKNKQGDVDGAIADWTVVIELPHAPTEQVALALNNRGTAMFERGNVDGAIGDWTAAIELPHAPAEQVADALNKRGSIRSGNLDGAIADWTAAIDLSDAPAELVALALKNRGAAMFERGNIDGALADYTSAIELPHAPVEQVASALINRSVAKLQRGDFNGAIADSTAAIELPGVSDELVAMALNNRGASNGRQGNVDAAIADYTAAIKLPGAPAKQVASALNNLGFSKFELGDADGAIADWTAVIELQDAPADQVAKALNHRGTVKGQRGDIDGAIADWTAAIELPGAPAEWVARALTYRGDAKFQRGDADGAIADWTAVIELQDAPAEQVARALYNRGKIKRWRGDRGDIDGAIADWTAAIELPGAPAEWVARARTNRGDAKFQRGDIDGVIADWTAVIELPGASTEHVARALYNRGTLKFQLGDAGGAIVDWTAVIELPGASTEHVARALINRGIARNEGGDVDGAIGDCTAAIELPGTPTAMVEIARNLSKAIPPKILAITDEN